LDRSLLTIERYVRAVESAEAAHHELAGYQGWARIHFAPAFMEAVDAQIRDLIQRQRVGMVGAGSMAALLGVLLSGASVHLLHKLPMHWARRGLLALGATWMAVVTAVVTALVRRV
jgi:hypothetical protein